MEDYKILYDTIISKMSDTLSDRQQLVIKSRFGLEEYANDIQSYSALSEILEIPCERVVRVEQIAIYALGERMYKLHPKFWDIFSRNLDIADDMCRIAVEMKRKNADIHKILVTEYLGLIYLLSILFMPNNKGLIYQKKHNAYFKRRCADLAEINAMQNFKLYI